MKITSRTGASGYIGRSLSAMRRSMKTCYRGRELVLIDGDDPSPRDAIIVRWSSLEARAGEYALSALVDGAAAELRAEYLTWIGSLAKSPTALGGLAQSLRIATLGGTSFWPLSLIVEKAPFKNSVIYLVFKLRLLERIYLQNGCSGIQYLGRDARLNRVLRQWCAMLDQPYRRGPKTGEAAVRKAWHERTPRWLQAFMFTAHVWFTRHRPSRRKQAPRLQGDMIIVTYFPNIDAERAAQGKFRSRFWESFHDLLEEQGTRTDWVWIYASDQFDYGSAVRLRDEFDAAAEGRQCHYLLHELLTPRALWGAVVGFAELYLKGLMVSRDIRRAFCFPGSRMNLFPLFAEEWDTSIFGKLAMEQLLYLAMFRELARANRATCLLYVWENHGWEKALIAACREASRVRLIGYQHATLPPLDLRPFPAGDDEIMPDILAVNGAAAANEMLENQFRPERLRVVTAVRYAHLMGCRGTQARTIPAQGRTLLVIGGYMEQESRFQLQLLRGSAAALSQYSRCIVKPHPCCAAALGEEIAALPTSVEVTTQPLTELWAQVDVVYCANSTSAAIEAAWLGLPLLVSSPGDSLNLSPLFGRPGLEFARDAAALSRQLEDPPRIELPPDYFCLDDDLESWREILQTCRRAR